jgi:hypothetical protein
MKMKHLPYVVFMVCIGSLSVFGQAAVVINDPTVEPAKIELSAVEQGLFDKNILPLARKKLASDICEESVDVTGRAQGSFTRAGARQTLIFYQFCQTGNGLGSIGVAIIDDGKVAANFVSAESGWSSFAATLPDINRNGLDEAALYYSGGMHQGAGGTGVDIVEFASGALRGIGWFQAEEFTETSPVMGYRVTVVPGKTPVMSREKYVQNAAGKWRKTGRIVPLKLEEAVSKFAAIN